MTYLRRDERSPGIVWVVSNVAMAKHFDRVAVFDRGGLVEEGDYADLSQKNGIFKDMITA